MTKTRSTRRFQPPTTGRKVVQSAQLNLTAAPSRIDAVAHEVYDVVGLIAIAALTPVGLVVALAWWVGAAVRRGRREQALDSV